MNIWAHTAKAPFFLIGPMDNSLAVFTVIYGEGYKLPPVKPTSGVDYICFTDRPNLEPNGWTIKTVRPLIDSDLPRSSRNPKIRPHRYLGNYSRTLYIDSSVELISSPLLLWEYLIGSENVVFGAMLHSLRDTVQEEFAAVSSHRLDAEHILAEHLKSYKEHTPETLDLKPVWGGLIARRHNSPVCVGAMEKWFAYVLRYSRRDQLSLPLVLSELAPDQINLRDCDNSETRYHRWPIKGYTRPKEYVESLKPGGEPRRESWYKYLRRKLNKSHAKNRKAIAPSTLSGTTFGFDDKNGLFYVEEVSNAGRVYVSDKKRLDLYRKGITHRIKWLLRDYRISESLIRANDFVIDIGANNGELGIWTKSKGGQYMGFEPDPAAFKALCQNVDSNYLFDIALGDSNGVAEFYLCTEEADSSLFPSNDKSNSIKVEKRTLDFLLDDIEIPSEIRLIKIEAEGMEPEVIAGAMKTLARAEFIAVDAGPERGGENTVPEVLNVLSNEGFSIISCFLLRGTFLLKKATK